MAVNGTHGFERKKTYTDKTKLNPAARDDTLRSKDTKRSVCARNRTVYNFLPLNHYTLQLPERIHNSRRVTLLYGESQTYKCITATYVSNGPLTLYLQSQLGVSMVQRFELKSLCSTEETKSPTSWMPLGYADKHHIFIFGWTIPLTWYVLVNVVLLLKLVLL